MLSSRVFWQDFKVQSEIQRCKLKFSALLEPAEEGGFVIKCVELPVTTEGETKREALANLKEAIEGYIEVRTDLLGKSRMKKRELVEVTVRKASSIVLA